MIHLQLTHLDVHETGRERGAEHAQQLHVTAASRLKHVQAQPLHILGPPWEPQVGQDVTTAYDS